jgi:hypothetical protein
MVNKVFGEVTFDAGWDVKEPVSVELWGKSYSVEVTVEADNEDDGITEEQEAVYADFTKNKAANQKRIEELLGKFYAENPPENLYHEEFLGEYLEDREIELEEFRKNVRKHLSEFLEPKYFEVNEEGGLALFFDDEIDPDNGMVVVLSPEESVMTQDEYL